jgi:hypothetical protein
LRSLDKAGLAQTRKETRRALWKQLLPGAAGFLFLCVLLQEALNPRSTIPVDFLWVLWLAGILLVCILCVVYIARRAIWLCLFRSVLLAVFMLTFVTVLLLAATEALSFDATLWLVGSEFAFFIVCSALVHFKRTIPYWRLTFAQNTARKIDLRKGVFSVATQWAGYPGSVTLAQRRLIYGLGPIAGALGMMLYRAVLGPSWDHVLAGAGSFVLLVGAAFWGSEAYHAYKLLELERQIGKPIVMDGYQEEERSAEGQTRG